QPDPDRSLRRGGGDPELRLPRQRPGAAGLRHPSRYPSKDSAFMTTAAVAAEGVTLELAKIESLIAGAHRLVTEGRLIDLSALDGKVRSLCEAVLDLRGPEARAAVHKLQSLLGSLDGLSAALQNRFGELPVLPSHGGAAAAYANLLKHFP